MGFKFLRIHFHFLARVASSQFYSVSCYLRRRRRLKEYESWDGIARMGCVAVRIDRQGTISQDMVHLVGFTEPKRLDARLIFGKEYPLRLQQVLVKPRNTETVQWRREEGRPAILG